MGSRFTYWDNIATMLMTNNQQIRDREEEHPSKRLMKDKFTTSLHFLIVSRFPRLISAFRARDTKFKVAIVSCKSELLGLTFAIRTALESPPEE